MASDDRFALSSDNSYLLVKVAVHPLSHNCPTEIREPEARDGKR